MKERERILGQHVQVIDFVDEGLHRPIKGTRETEESESLYRVMKSLTKEI